MVKFDQLPYDILIHIFRNVHSIDMQNFLIMNKRLSKIARKRIYEKCFIGVIYAYGHGYVWDFDTTDAIPMNTFTYSGFTSFLSENPTYVVRKLEFITITDISATLLILRDFMRVRQFFRPSDFEFKCAVYTEKINHTHMAQLSKHTYLRSMAISPSPDMFPHFWQKDFCFNLKLKELVLYRGKGIQRSNYRSLNLGKLTNLRKLEIWHNDVKFKDFDFLNEMTHLRRFYIRGNRMNCEADFSNVPSLKEISFDDVGLKGAIILPPGIKKFEIRHDPKYKVFESCDFSSNKYLRKLTLVGMDLRSIPAEKLPPKLIELDVGDNVINVVDLSSMKSLVKVNLEYNRPVKVINRASDVHKPIDKRLGDPLNLNRCKFPPSLIDLNVKEVLTAPSTKKWFPTTLKVLTCSLYFGNPIPKFPPNIEELHVQGSLSSAKSYFKVRFEHLKILDLSRCLSNNLHSDFFENLPCLEELCTRDNYLEDDNDIFFPRHLKRLDISYNKYEEIQSHWFSSNLIWLNICGNPGTDSYIPNERIRLLSMDRMKLLR